MRRNASTFREPRTRRLRTIGIAVAALTMLSAAYAAPVYAGHTIGSLDCGGDLVFEVDGRTVPAGIEAPGPWSGLFLLEGTTSVFKAFSIQGPAFPYRLNAKASPKDLITCTLFSDGMGFPEGSWVLEGVFRP